jgi:hypothetical protein
MAFVPSRAAFMSKLGDSEDVVLQQIDVFVRDFGDVIRRLHAWLVRSSSARSRRVDMQHASTSYFAALSALLCPNDLHPPLLRETVD